MVQDGDLFVLEQTGVAKKLTGSVWANWLLNKIDGIGTITNIQKTGSSGTNPVIDTYTITFVKTEDIGDDNPTGTPYTFTFNVTNGVRGPTGATGATGPAAQITSREVLYQESTSGTVPDGTWTTTQPTVAAGNYLWTHITINFDSGSVDWYEIVRQPIDGTGSFKVNNIAPDANNNIALSATSIPYGNSNVGSALDGLENVASGKQATITAPGILKGNGSGVITTAAVGNDYGGRGFTVTLLASGWTNNEQDISYSYFKSAGAIYIVSPSSASREEYIDCNIYADNATNFHMVFHCDTVPTNDLVVNIGLVVSAT